MSVHNNYQLTTDACYAKMIEIQRISGVLNEKGPYINRYSRILFVSDGNFKVQVEDETVNLASGNVMLIDAQVRHKISSDSETNVLFSIFYDFGRERTFSLSTKTFCNDFESFMNFQSASKPYILFSDDNIMIRTSFTNLKRISPNNKNEYNIAACMLISIVLFEAIKSQKYGGVKLDSGKTKHVRNAMKYIQSNYSCDIYVKDVAGYVGVHPCYMQRIFKNEVGISVSEYINQQRINKACHMLTYTDMPIHEISSRIGIMTQQYFDSLFKKYTGMSPSEYRKSVYVKIVHDSSYNRNTEIKNEEKAE